MKKNARQRGIKCLNDILLFGLSDKVMEATSRRKKQVGSRK